jgi:hypothetical protein
MSWNIPHDERHRFLEFGLRDAVFFNWVAWFDEKKVPYEVAGSADNWTIYKHMWYVADPNTGRIARCCPMDEEM